MRMEGFDQNNSIKRLSQESRNWKLIVDVYLQVYKLEAVSRDLTSLLFSL